MFIDKRKKRKFSVEKTFVKFGVLFIFVVLVLIKTYR